MLAGAETGFRNEYPKLFAELSASTCSCSGTDYFPVGQNHRLAIVFPGMAGALMASENLKTDKLGALARRLVQPRHVYMLWVVVVGWVGLNYALKRVFQVDEFQMAQNAVLMAKGGEWLDYAPIRPFYLVLLSHVLEPAWDTLATLSILRAIFFALLLVNLSLIVQVQPFFKGKWQKILVLFGATMLLPLWEHGIEIRGDNPELFFELCGMGCGFAALASSGRKRLLYFALLGLSAAGMHYSTAKGFALWPPHVAMALGGCFLSERERTWQKTALWLCFLITGMLAGILGVFLVQHFSGTLRSGMVSAGLKKNFIKHSLATHRFLPWPLLKTNVLKSPAVSVMCVLGLAGLLKRLADRGWRDSLPGLVCLGYLLWSLVFIRLNPTPYPYNMLHIAPFAFIFALGGVQWCLKYNRTLLLALVAILFMSFVREAQISPFFLASNFQQTSYIDAAEYLTPENESVLDGVGMVTNRPPPAKSWHLHSMYMGAYRAGLRDNFAEIMREKKPPVVITSYRWSWLGKEEHEVLASMYVEPHPDFHVLGADIHPWTTEITIPRSGFYAVRTSVPPMAVLTIDETDYRDRDIVRLDAGIREVRATHKASLLWVPEGSEHFPPLIVDERAQLFLK